MKTRKILVTLFIILGLMLVACGGNGEPAAAPVEEATDAPAATEVEESAEEAPTEAPAEEEATEPAAEEATEPAEEEAAEADLDTAFQTFLDDMEAYNTIDVEGLNQMIVEGNAPYMLDVRETSELEEKGWIEGAVHIPLREVVDHVDALPSFDTTIVSYCGSGWRCTIAMTALEALGWQDVLSLKGGSFGGWVEAGYPIEEGTPPEPQALNAADPDPAMVAAMGEMLANVPDGYGVITVDDLNMELVENPEITLIDVRRPEEVEEKGYIDAPNVHFIPLETFVAEQEAWPTDQEAPIVVYCGSGHRSTIAMSILWSYGYSDVRSMKAGFNGWVEAGYPGVGVPEEAAAGAEANLDEAFQVFLEDMEAYNTIGLDELNLMLVEDPPPFLLDVRQPEELEEKGYIEGAVNIPLRELMDHVDKLPSFDTTIVSYCGSGWRCTIAMTALEALGWQDVLSLKGGSFGGWVEAGYPVAEAPPLEPMVLEAAEPDPALVEMMDEMLANIPDGYGGINVDDLNATLIENADLILIDVRRPEEVAENGVIEAENLLLIPLETFIEQMAEWPEEMDAPIVIYCGSGHRSTIAMTILWAYGYNDVHSLQGGFGAWTEAGYPVMEMANE